MGHPAPSIHWRDNIWIQSVLSNLFVQTLNDNPKVENESNSDDRQDDRNGDVTSCQTRNAENGATDDDEDDSDDSKDDANHREDQPRQKHAAVAHRRSPYEEDVNDDAENFEADDGS